MSASFFKHRNFLKNQEVAVFLCLKIIANKRKRSFFRTFVQDGLEENVHFYFNKEIVEIKVDKWVKGCYYKSINF